MNCVPSIFLGMVLLSALVDFVRPYLRDVFLLILVYAYTSGVSPYHIFDTGCICCLFFVCNNFVA